MYYNIAKRERQATRSGAENITCVLFEEEVLLRGDWLYYSQSFSPRYKFESGGKKGANPASLNRADISKYTRVAK